MPPSQLKGLKAKLREQGILGPQQSKKQRKQNVQTGTNKDKRVNRKVALDGIREQFNPFEFKQAGGRGPKFEVTSMEGRKGKGVLRPGLQRSREQEMRNASINEEYYSRNKVGGLIDKRFGENDPTMAPEDKMLERYTRAQLKGKTSAFDLEDDETGELTHMGKSLSLNGPKIQDDFEEEDLELSDADEERPILKRRRSDMEGAEEDNHEGADEGADDEDLPERKKSKQEVMKELIAKSKLHKYERQAAKDDDDDLREELDKEMPNIHALLRGIGPKTPSAPVAEIPGMNPGRLALLHGTEKARIEKDYDIQLRQLAQDQRSKPTEKSKTEEQIIEERARKLQDLEAKRLRRMQGAPESSDEEDVKDRPSEEDEEDEFGLGAGIKARPTMVELGIDDEDDFLIDDGLVASGSEMYDSDVESSDGGKALEEEEEDEFVKGILTKEEAGRPEFLTGANGPVQEVEDLAKNGINGNLAYSFECPQSHEELLQVMKKVAILDLPTAIQRIRTIHSPNLRSESKAKLAKFAVALVDHISYLANQEKPPPFAVLEAVIRHIHSLAKTYAVEVANAFRRQLEDIHKTRSLAFTPGDLVIFTAIGNIFPTSDHFHQVVTPAILAMARYLGLKIPQSLSDYAIGTYLCALCIQYQRLSKRYVPEAMSFIENTLCVLAPKKFGRIPGNFPFHEPKTAMQITSAPNSTRKLTFYDCVYKEGSAEEQLELKIAIMEADIKLLGAAVDLWTGLPAYAEIFDPVLKIVKHLSGKGCRAMLPESTKVVLSSLHDKLNMQLQTARLKRRPLELHHHRPLAIKTAIPKFEESFNPDRHYDPDRERTEAAKFKKEYKREHKGAVRALRKDAKITATRELRDKRERDEAYEKNQKRLIAMIQGEEGREQKAYAREKEWRKKGKK